MTWPPPRHSVASTVATALGIALVAAGVGHLLATRGLDWLRLERQCGHARVELARLSDRATQAAALEELVAKAERRLGEAELSVSEKQLVPSLLAQLNALAEETDCDLVTFEPGELSRHRLYLRLPFVAAMQGGFEALHQFLTKLAEQPKAIAVEALSLSTPPPPEPDPEASGGVETPEHRVAMELNAIAFVFPLETGEPDSYSDEPYDSAIGDVEDDDETAVAEEADEANESDEEGGEKADEDGTTDEAGSDSDSGGGDRDALPAGDKEPDEPAEKPAADSNEDAAALLESLYN